MIRSSQHDVARYGTILGVRVNASAAAIASLQIFGCGTSKVPRLELRLSFSSTKPAELPHKTAYTKTIKAS